MSKTNVKRSAGPVKKTTGKKPTVKSTSPQKPKAIVPCKYGDTCRHSQPEHFLEFAHPPNHEMANPRAITLLQYVPSQKPASTPGCPPAQEVCKFDEIQSCRLTQDPAHLARFSHPSLIEVIPDIPPEQASPSDKENSSPPALPVQKEPINASRPPREERHLGRGRGRGGRERELGRPVRVTPEDLTDLDTNLSDTNRSRPKPAPIRRMPLTQESPALPTRPIRGPVQGFNPNSNTSFSAIGTPPTYLPYQGPIPMMSPYMPSPLQFFPPQHHHPQTGVPFYNPTLPSHPIPGDAYPPYQGPGYHPSPMYPMLYMQPPLAPNSHFLPPHVHLTPYPSDPAVHGSDSTEGEDSFEYLDPEAEAQYDKFLKQLHPQNDEEEFQKDFEDFVREQGCEVEGESESSEGSVDEFSGEYLAYMATLPVEEQVYQVHPAKYYY